MWMTFSLPPKLSSSQTDSRFPDTRKINATNMNLKMYTWSPLEKIPLCLYRLTMYLFIDTDLVIYFSMKKFSNEVIVVIEY